MSEPKKEPLLQVWLADTIHAARALLATPRYSLPALLSLVLGIAASTAVFAVFNAIVLRPLPFPNEDALVDVRLGGVTADDDGTGTDLSYTYYSEFKDLKNVFASVSGYTRGGVTITGSGDARHASAGKVTPEFFDTLLADAEVGRTFTAKGASPDPAGVAVLSHSYWKSSFGGAPVTGTTIVVDGKPKTVVGVISDDRSLPANVDLWTPIQVSDEERSERFRLLFGAVGRLNPGTSVETARQILRAAGAAQNMRSPDGTLVYGTVSPLRDSLVGDKRTSATLMLIAVGAFLLLACANVASLLTTRASVRARELAIRAAIGAGPATLARENGLEAVVLTVVGGGLGLLASAGFVEFANRVLSSELEYTPARLDANVLLAFGALAAISTLIVGIAPTVHALHVRPMDSLRAEGRSSSSRGARRFREVLVALQVAITLALMVGAALLIRSVQELGAVRPGFDPHAVAARVLFPDARKESPERRVAFAREVLDRASHLPGVTGAAIASDVPFGNGQMALGLQMEPKAPKENVVAGLRLIGPGYFEAMGIPLLSGRGFQSGDAAKGVHRVVVNRAFAMQVVGTLNAVGHQLSYREHEEVPEAEQGAEGAPKRQGAQIWYDIVGVADDSLEDSVTKGAEPLVYANIESLAAMSLMESGVAVVARSSGDGDALLGALATVARSVDRDAAVYDVDTLGNMVQRSYRQRSSLEALLGAFALASIILAAIGLFGVTSYAVAERSGEIGIRRALGATRGTIIGMILGETGVIVGFGALAGLACAWSMRTLLASFVYGVGTTDPVVYLAVALGIGVVAMLAALAPARAAASVTPSRALEVR
ncbi:MAG TPA: ADOP family duplicated permease [Polyangiaceae bacterium]|jgi:predicted permease